MISILASLFLEHSVCQLLIIFNVFDDANGAENGKLSGVTYMLTALYTIKA